MKFIDFLESINRLGILLIKMFYLASNSNSNLIFVFPGVDLDNRILISSRNSDLEFSTSSTVEARASEASRAAPGCPKKVKIGM